MRKKIMTGLVALTVMSGTLPAVAENGNRFAQNSASQRQQGETPMAKMLSSLEGRLHLDQRQRSVWQDYRNALMRAEQHRPDGDRPRDDQQGRPARQPQKDGRPLLAEMLAQGPLHDTPQAEVLMRAARGVRSGMSPEQIEQIVRAEANLPKPPQGDRPHRSNNG
jgi:hypothetical protein